MVQRNIMMAQCNVVFTTISLHCPFVSAVCHAQSYELPPMHQPLPPSDWALFQDFCFIPWPRTFYGKAYEPHSLSYRGRKGWQRRRDGVDIGHWMKMRSARQKICGGCSGYEVFKSTEKRRDSLVNQKIFMSMSFPNHGRLNKPMLFRT
jgi:hypothetical protein